MKSTNFALSAVLVLAITLTFSCSGDDGDGGGGSSGGGGSVKDNNGKMYKTVQIGTQTWMAENLNIDVPGSVCYDKKSANCDKYGRLYDWTTAMALPSKCNTTLSTSDSDCAIKTPNHQGICPTGWHIPSNEDWDRLMRYVDGSTGTSSHYDSYTAGRYLKATDGWNDCGPSGSGKSYLCEDTYGFSALPGGSGGYSYFDGEEGVFFSDEDDLGYYGNWWSASEYYSDSDSPFFSGMVYYMLMYYDEYAGRAYSRKVVFFSVRCVQD